MHSKKLQDGIHESQEKNTKTPDGYKFLYQRVSRHCLRDVHQNILDGPEISHN